MLKLFIDYPIGASIFTTAFLGFGSVGLNLICRYLGFDLFLFVLLLLGVR